MKKTIFWILFIVLVGVAIELISYPCLFVLAKFYNTEYEPADVISEQHQSTMKALIKGKPIYIKYSPSLGWSIKQNGRFDIHHSNSLGIRSSREYTQKPPVNTLRISAFGDSFTHCDGVNNEETWEAILENDDPPLEVMNFGVWGYGLDQAYLRYLEDGLKYKPHVVFIGFMTENIFRHVNVFRPFYMRQNTAMPLTKPRFTINDNRLNLLPNPMHGLEGYAQFLSHPKPTLSALGLHDYHYLLRYNSSPFDFSSTVRLLTITVNTIRNRFREDIIINGYYNETSEAFIITKKLFDNFYENVIDNGSIPIILIFPYDKDITRFHNDRTKQYTPLLEHFDSKAYRYIDLMDAFVDVGEKYTVKDLFAFAGHFSPLANKLIARHIQSYLNRSGLKQKDVVLSQQI